MGNFPDGLNNALINLIPKKSIPSSINDHRLISLCNVLYKIMAKVLANKLKSILPSIILE